MDSLFRNIDAFYGLIKLTQVTTELSPSSSTTTDENTQASEALSKGGQELIEFIRTHGKDMSAAFPKRAYLYDFPGKTGSTCVFDNHIVQFSVKLIPVEKQQHSDMKSDHDSTVKYIVKWIKRDSATTDIANNPQAIENLVLNLIGQKSSESSVYNYNFGFIQATANGMLDEYWKGDVFVISDYNTKNGVKVPYIWPYVSLRTFEDGINYWLNFLKKRGFINSAKQTGEAFVAALQKGRYFDLPMKTITDPSTGEQKKVVDEEKAKEVRDRYYKNSLHLREDKGVTRAIQRYVYGNMNG